MTERQKQVRVSYLPMPLNQAKKILRMVEEAKAGRMESLKGATPEELVLVLDAVKQKQLRDKQYLAKSKHQSTLSDSPELPSLENRMAFVQAGVGFGELFQRAGLTLAAIEAGPLLGTNRK